MENPLKLCLSRSWRDEFYLLGA